MRPSYHADITSRIVCRLAGPVFRSISVASNWLPEPLSRSMVVRSWVCLLNRLRRHTWNWSTSTRGRQAALRSYGASECAAGPVRRQDRALRVAVAREDLLLHGDSALRASRVAQYAAVPILPKKLEGKHRRVWILNKVSLLLDI